MRLIIAMVVALASTAAADPGQQHSERGQALYHDGKYREAHAEFAAGFEASKLPAFVFNMAECSRLVGDIESARSEYTDFLALEPDGKLAPLAKQRLGALPPPPPAVTKPVPTPAVVAQQHVDVVAQPAPIAMTTIVDEPTPLWRRKSVWIVVGAALVAGTVATIAIAHHGTECSGMCLDWSKP